MARSAYPSDQTDKIMLRFPGGLKARIREIADSNYRSINSEIIMRLERSVFDELKNPDRDAAVHDQAMPAGAIAAE